MMPVQQSRGRRVAIIGGGMIGAVHRRAALLAGAHVVGVLASTPQRSRDIAEKCGVPTGFESLEELLSADVDVVHICTPNAMHAPYALRAVAAGKHVICEKPLGLDLDEARQMVEAGSAAGLVTAVPFCFEDFVADACAAIDGAQSESLPTFADGCRSAELVDALLRSAPTGDWVDSRHSRVP